MRYKNKQDNSKLAKNTSNDVQIAILAIVKNILVRGENKRKCTSFCSKFYLELDPQSEIENILAKKIISFAWKIERLLKLETSILSKINKPDDYDDRGWYNEKKIHRMRNLKKIKPDSPEVRSLHLQQIALEKAFSKALDQYHIEQNLRSQSGINN